MNKQQLFLVVCASALAVLCVGASVQQNPILLRKFIFRGSVLTPFTRVEGLNTKGRSPGSFIIRRLVLSVDEIRSLQDYEIEVTRLNSHFPQATFTPTNSDISIVYSSSTDRIMCWILLSVFPNNRPRSRFLYIGEVNNNACSSSMEVVNGRRVTMRAGLVSVNRITFVRAEQTDVAGTSTSVQISRSAEQAAQSDDLINLTLP